jgi:GTP-binding protein
MREQAEIAMDMADMILFLVDGKEGLTSSDRDVANILMRTRKEVLLVVNKVDTQKLPDDFYDFYELGLGEPLAISAANMLGLGDLLEKIADSLPKNAASDDDDETIRVAVIGKPNVGKSSLVNEILGENRVIVSDIAGTTRDSVDSPFEKDGDKYVLVDTAGLRRQSKVSGDIERYSVIRAAAAIERSDVCLLLIDASEGVTEQDKRIAGLAHEAGKGVVIVVNKWDLVGKETKTMRDYEKTVKNELIFLSYAPMVFISVLEKQRIDKVIETTKAVSEIRALRVQTGQLNSLVADAVMMKQPPSDKGRRLKVYYVSQIGVKPPLFAFKVNDESLVHFSYSRYLENRLRDSYGFAGTSIKFVFHGRGENSET